MNLTLFVTDNCDACRRAERNIREVITDIKDTNFVVKNVKEEKPQSVFIVPALFVNDQLFLYGEVDIDKLKKKIS